MENLEKILFMIGLLIVGIIAFVILLSRRLRSQNHHETIPVYERAGEPEFFEQ